MGLYIYGALLMAMTFVVGLIASDPFLMALAVLSCAIAALSEAMNDFAQSDFGLGKWPRGYRVVNATAILSWFIAAIAALYAVLSLIGGA